MDPLLGRTLDGRYRLDRRVGAGGFGTVYAATVTSGDASGSVVAVKVLRPPEGAATERSEDRARRFRDEAALLLRLRHPSIVPALGSGTLDEGGERVPYLVLEWCEGGTLEEELARRAGRGMPLAEALAVVSPVLDALAHAHDLGVVHRDIKPSNVMLARGPDGSLTPRVIDFGIAKIVVPDGADSVGGSGETKTASSSIAFTPAYAAPEQVAGARTGPFTDVHALGLLVVELLRGRAPYAGDPLRVIDPVRPTPALFGVDVGPLEPVLARALALRPDARYPDARALAEAVRAAWHTEGHASTVLASPRAPALASPPVSLAPPGHEGAAIATAPTEVARPSGRPPRARGWLVGGLAGSLVLVSALALGLYVWGAQRGAETASVTSRTTVREFQDAAPLSTPSSSAAPRAPFDLCAASRAELEARVAPAKVLSASVDEQSRTLFFSNPDGTDPGSHYLQVTSLAHLEAVAEPERSRARDRIIANQVPGDNGLVYGATPRCLAMLRGPRSPATLRVFERIAAGARFELRGDTLGGPNPANERSSAFRVPHVAKRLRELSVDELESRLRSHGGVESFDPNTLGASAILRHEASAGTIVLYRVAAARALRELEKTVPIAFHYALDGEVGIALYGTGPFAEAAYLRKVLDGVVIHPAAAPRPGLSRGR